MADPAVGASEFGSGMATGGQVPGMLLKAGDKAISLGLPGMKGFEERLEDVMDIEVQEAAENLDEDWGLEDEEDAS